MRALLKELGEKRLAAAPQQDSSAQNLLSQALSELCRSSAE